MQTDRASIIAQEVSKNLWWKLAGEAFVSATMSLEYFNSEYDPKKPVGTQFARLRRPTGCKAPDKQNSFMS